MNTTTLIGRLTADPVIRNTKSDGSGKAVANFTIAVNRMKNGEQVTKFMKVVAWGNLAASTSALTKGTSVVVIGEFDDTPSMWTGKDGNVRADNILTADVIAVQLSKKAVNTTANGEVAFA